MRMTNWLQKCSFFFLATIEVPEADSEQQIPVAPHREAFTQTGSDLADGEFFYASEAISPRSPSTDWGPGFAPTADPPRHPSPIPTPRATQSEWVGFDNPGHVSCAKAKPSWDPLPQDDSPAFPVSSGGVAPTIPTAARIFADFSAVPVDITVRAGGFDGEGAFPPVIPSAIPAIKAAPAPKWSWTQHHPPRISADGHVWPGVPNALYHNWVGNEMFMQLNEAKNPTPIITRPELPESITSCDWLLGHPTRHAYPTPNPRPTRRQRALEKARRVPAKVKAWVRGLRHPMAKPHESAMHAQMAAMAAEQEQGLAQGLLFRC